MIVKTIVVEEIYPTLHKKILNFGVNNLRYTGAFEATEYIKKNFPSVSYPELGPEMLVWCESNFGNDWIWNWSTIYFKHEKDKILFLLRWL
jgi:hypothetical protein